MRILVHGVFPGVPSGYGRQCGHIARGLAGLGHDVAISAYHGLYGTPGVWEGLPVYPGARDDWGMDVLPAHYRHFGAQAVVTLTDTWCIKPEALTGRGLKMAFVTPVDTDPLGDPDESVLRRTHALPLAMSHHGMRMMQDAYFHPMYTPHCIDTGTFAPPADRGQLRREMGLEGRFVVGINASNADGRRKGYSEQFQAFAAFQARHPDALLLVHTLADNVMGGGINLRRLADRLALRVPEDVQFADEHAVIAGLLGDEAMAAWYGALDVLSNCSQGEGFGLPIIEAQACGTPVVVTKASSMPELAGTGWRVGGQRAWHQMHNAWWLSPDVGEIARAYELARIAGERKRRQAREFALAYDHKRIIGEHWPPVIERLS